MSKREDLIHEYNAAIANGNVTKARQIDRVINALPVPASPAPAGLDVERLAKAVEASMMTGARYNMEFDSVRLAVRIADYYARAATRPAEDAGETEEGPGA